MGTSWNLASICCCLFLATGVGCAHQPHWQGPTELLDIAAGFHLQWDRITGQRNPVNDMVIDWMTPSDKGYVTEDTVGFWIQGTTVIKIDRDTWFNLCGYGKEQLIFHEMAHFILARPHTEQTFPCYEMEDGCPVSLMHPVMISPKVYKLYHEYYMVELFGG